MAVFLCRQPVFPETLTINSSRTLRWAGLSQPNPRRSGKSASSTSTYLPRKRRTGKRAPDPQCLNHQKRGRDQRAPNSRVLDYAGPRSPLGRCLGPLHHSLPCPASQTSHAPRCNTDLL